MLEPSLNITKAQYVNSIASGELSHIHATIDGEEIDVPVNEQNRHYVEIQRQVKAGTLTIKDAD